MRIHLGLTSYLQVNFVTEQAFRVILIYKDYALVTESSYVPSFFNNMHRDEDVDLRRDEGPQGCHVCAILRPSGAADQPLKPQGRRYIPHGHGEEASYRPHVQHIEPDLTECDLDWKSRLRWLPQPRYSDAPFPEIKAAKFPDGARLLRSFPHDNMISESEWTFYPSFGLPVTYHIGKRCLIDGVHHYRSLRSSSERTLELRLGRKRQIRSPCCVIRGSRPYISPEYSTDFHKFGSTLPAVGFGSSATLKGDTFIPLQRPTGRQCMTYRQKKALKDREADVLEVRKLDDWRPAAPITPPLCENRHGKHKKADCSWRTVQGEKLASSMSALPSTKMK
ncbi:spermatogenesis-associated serine-rich protein 1 [Anguilla rostrata]|uniref:spermatogenesis-associated serine-rich protein 1 n=1 Tax=Anguilla rostrata TaxID=7938 RepID=UPI0030D287F0